MDCGCASSTKVCMQNQCVANITLPSSSGSQAACYQVSDCDDHKSCTVDTCNTQYTPARCEHLDITTCQHNDGCCPPFCVTQGDSDCAAIDACSFDWECDDTNACTRNACSGTPKRCVTLETQPGCSVQESCIPLGTSINSSYCASDNILVSLKEAGDSCQSADECLSRICSFKTCRTSSAFTHISRWIFYITLVCAIIIALVLLFLHVRKPTTSPLHPDQ